jgi:hypothetical protein
MHCYSNDCSCSSYCRQPQPAIIYGGAYNPIEERPVISSNGTYIFPLTAVSELKNVAQDSNGLRIEKSGVYEVSYNANFSSNNNDFVLLEVIDGSGNIIPGTSIFLNILAGDIDNSYRATTIRLPAGTRLQLRATSTNGGTWFIPIRGAELRVVRIGC